MYRESLSDLFNALCDEFNTSGKAYVDYRLYKKSVKIKIDEVLAKALSICDDFQKVQDTMLDLQIGSATYHLLDPKDYGRWLWDKKNAHYVMMYIRDIMGNDTVDYDEIVSGAVGLQVERWIGKALRKAEKRLNNPDSTPA